MANNISDKRSIRLMAAPFAPFASDGSVRTDVIDRYAAWLHAHGVSGAFVNGTTGEGCSLSVAERQAIAARWTASAPSGFRIIVHVGALALPDAQTLAAHAQSIGAAAIAAVAPSFYKPDVQSLADWCSAVARSAPSLPFYFYHMPAMTGVHVRMRELIPHLLERIPNLGGVKFTHEDLFDYGCCVSRWGGRLEFSYGRDEALLPALSLGAPSATGSTFNLWPEVYLRMIDAFRHGDLDAARAEQERARTLIDLAIAHGGMPAMKAAMHLVHGIDCGPCRSPLTDPDPARATTFATAITGAMS